MGNTKNKTTTRLNMTVTYNLGLNLGRFGSTGGVTNEPLLEDWVVDLGAIAEVALGVDEEIVWAEAGHVGGADIGVVPPHLPVILLLILCQVPGRTQQRVHPRGRRRQSSAAGKP